MAVFLGGFAEFESEGGRRFGTVGEPLENWDLLF